ncbi:MAG: hypothetical protein CL847_03985 [Crocinitomicaceae bacterium]|nr:hypothetical protein [Crocinitomicaceae bacterium]|tara:strand:+ start:516 stop:707 length:192 start_codon:yes stop_codon:yes gene_type:complete
MMKKQKDEKTKTLFGFDNTFFVDCENSLGKNSSFCLFIFYTSTSLLFSYHISFFFLFIIIIFH